MHSRILSFIALWVTLLAFNITTCADDSVSSDVGQADLTLRTFVKDILESTPRLKAAHMALVSKKSTRDAETQPLYNPDFVLDTEDSNSQTHTLGISQTLDWSGKRKARTQVADSNYLFAETEFLALRREFTAELLKGLAIHQTSLSRYELVLERQQLMNDLVNLAQSRFDAGDISNVELDLVKLAAMKVRIKRAAVQAESSKAKYAVQAQTPLTHVAEWPVLINNFRELPKNVDHEVYMQRLPEVQLAKLSIQINDSLAEVHRTEQRPDPTVTVTGGKEDAELSVGLSLSIPLFIRNSLKHEVNAAIAKRTEAELIAQDVSQRARIRIENATERFDIFRSAWTDWQSTSKESLSRPIDQLQRLWETGELSTTDYVVQLTQTLEVRESALELNRSLWLAWFDWLMASGQIDVWLGLDT